MQCYAEPALKATRRSARQRVDVHSKCNLEILLCLIHIGKISAVEGVPHVSIVEFDGHRRCMLKGVGRWNDWRLDGQDLDEVWTMIQMNEALIDKRLHPTMICQGSQDSPCAQI
jgi:hypothetical protein